MAGDAKRLPFSLFLPLFLTMSRSLVVDGAVVFSALALVRVLPLWWLLVLSAWLGVAWFILRCFCQSPLDLPFVVLDIQAAITQFCVRMVLHQGKPRFSEWTVALEGIQTVANRLMTKYGPNLVLERNAQAARSLTALAGTFDGMASCAQSSTVVQPLVLNGLEHLWLRSKKQAVEGAKRYVVIYYHGGGYTILSPRLYITLTNRIRDEILKASKASDAIEIDVFLANYRKAPEVQFPLPQQDAVQAFEYIRDDVGVPPDRIILAGDSAGAGLVVSTLLRLRDDKKAQLPLAAVLFYPLVDVTNDANPQRGKDCILSRSFIRATTQALLPTCEDPSTWKDLSSVHCDLHGLPPTLIQVGTADYLYSDSVKLFNKAQSDGVANWELDVLPNIPHIFATLPPAVVPQAVAAFQRIGEFVVKHMDQAVSDKTE